MLVLRFWHVGDLVLTTAALGALRRAWPETRIELAVDERLAELLEDHPWLDGVRRWPSSKGGWLRRLVAKLRFLGSVWRARFSLTLDLHGNDRAGIVALAAASPRVASIRKRWWLRSVARPTVGIGHALDEKLQLLAALGVSTAGARPHLVPGTEALRHVDELLPRDGRPLVVCAPGATYPRKRWPVASFARACGSLVEAGCTVRIAWGPGEEPLARELAALLPSGALLPATSLRELAALLGRASLFLGNDSGPMHIAAAMNTPCVVVFGPTDEREWGPRDVPWRPIRALGPCPRCPARTTCREGEGAECMTRVPPEAVVRAALTLLGPSARECGMVSEETTAPEQPGRTVQGLAAPPEPSMTARPSCAS